MDLCIRRAISNGQTLRRTFSKLSRRFSDYATLGTDLLMQRCTAQAATLELILQ